MVTLDPNSRFISSPRVSSSEWATWLGRLAMADVSSYQLVGKDERLVVVSPHPDDEILMCGALIASHAWQGGDVLIVAVTDGEASHSGAAHHDPTALAATRRRESAAGLHCLGIEPTKVARLGLPDGGLSRSAPTLRDRLRKFIQPNDVVVTTWRLDGHPDHETCGTSAAVVCAEVGARLLEAPVWMWHWAVTSDTQVPWHQLHSMRIDPILRTRKLEALTEHHSQLAPRSQHLPAVLDSALIARAGWANEYYF